MKKKKKEPISNQPFQIHNAAISNSALADFLIQLAKLYASPEFGNPALATALRELARNVRRSSSSNIRKNRLSKEGITTQPTHNLEILKGLDHLSVERFIADETKTKNELLDLAEARFSIPRSQLKRMKIVEVQQVIQSALLHESSIEIISKEARRDGSTRSS
jgi:hypothetical protein